MHLEIRIYYVTLQNCYNKNPAYVHMQWRTKPIPLPGDSFETNFVQHRTYFIFDVSWTVTFLHLLRCLGSMKGTQDQSLGSWQAWIKPFSHNHQTDPKIVNVKQFYVQKMSTHLWGKLIRPEMSPPSWFINLTETWMGCLHFCPTLTTLLVLDGVYI